LYTLLCARLPFDDEYIPSLFKKIRGMALLPNITIIAGVFDVPSHVSSSCKDLISAMLVVDPLKRITIEEIRKHEWFQINLPKYLSYPASVYTQKIQDIDEDILQEIAKVNTNCFEY
jgi:5'-AMP-activated protein kinase catalytic alpha subunit